MCFDCGASGQLILTIYEVIIELIRDRRLLFSVPSHRRENAKVAKLRSLVGQRTT